MKSIIVSVATGILTLTMIALLIIKDSLLGCIGELPLLVRNIRILN